MIREFANTLATEKNIKIVLEGFQDEYKANGENNSNLTQKGKKLPAETHN